MRRRVVVTGIGWVTPLGAEIEPVWRRLLNGESGVGYITRFDASNFPTKIAAEVKDFAGQFVFAANANIIAKLKETGALLGLLPTACVRRETVEEKKNYPRPDVKSEYRRTICTHCSVGCGIIAELQNGVWVGQEPDYEAALAATKKLL